MVALKDVLKREGIRNAGAFIGSVIHKELAPVINRYARSELITGVVEVVIVGVVANLVKPRSPDAERFKEDILTGWLGAMYHDFVQLKRPSLAEMAMSALSPPTAVPAPSYSYSLTPMAAAPAPSPTF